MANRVQECVKIMRKLRNELHIPADDPGIKELSSRMNDYIKHGKVWSGYIQLVSIKRHLHVIFPTNPVFEIRAVIKAVEPTT